MDAFELQRWLVALFVAGCILFGYPLLSVYSVPETIGGIPVLYVIVFTIWAVLIAVSAWVLQRAARTDAGGP